MNVRPHCRLHCLFAFFVLSKATSLCFPANAQTSVESPQLKMSLLADQASISANSSHTAVPPHVGLLFDLEPGWHVYWTNAGDSGEPPTMKWTLPAGVTVGPL